MKSNYFKYIFIIFAVAILIFAIVKIKTDEQKIEAQVYQEEQKIEEIKEIKLGVASFDTMNPILSKNKNVQDISKLIFEPLMDLTSDYKIENCLAKECAKQNENTYIIKLRDDREWSDGEKFTAEDVKFTIDRINDTDNIYKSNVENITSLEVVDDTTIRIILNQEIPFFEYKLTFPILSSKFYSDKEFNGDIVPIGTGMYMASEVQGSAIILTKNEYYPDAEKLKLEKITVSIFAGIGELYNSFKTANLDIVSTQNNNLKEYIGTIGYLSKEMKGREHDFIALNTQNPILSQTAVRRAIAYSIDKSNIVSSIYGDEYYTSNFPLDYGSWLYQEQDVSSGYNTEQAKQLLSEDGWTFTNRNWQKNINYRTQSIALNLVVKASDENRVKVAENIKNQLAGQGIIINIVGVPDDQYLNYVATRNYDMLLCSVNLSVSPDLSTFFGANNLANYSNDEVTNIMNEIKNQNDEEKLKQNFKRLGEIYKIEIPYISLYNNKYMFAYNSDLVGTIEPNWFNPFYGIGDWHK